MDELNFLTNFSDIDAMIKNYQKALSNFSHIAFFGTGRDARLLTEHLAGVLGGGTDIFFVDNDSTKHTRKIFEKYECYGKEKLLSLPADDSVIIVASSKFARDIESEIDELYASAGIERKPVVWWRLVILLRLQANRMNPKSLKYLKIEEEWAEYSDTVPEKLSGLIRYFNRHRTHKSIFVTDEKGQYRGLIPRSILELSGDVATNQAILKISIPPRDSEDELVSYARKILMRHPLVDELPIVENGRIVSTVMIRHGQSFEDRLGVLDWSLIPIYIAQNFFGRMPSIFLASKSRSMLGFMERFRDIANISIHEDSVPFSADYFLFQDSVPENMRGKVTNCYSLIYVYGELLFRTVKDYFRGNGIRFYFMDISGKPKTDRVSSKKMISYQNAEETALLPGGLRVHRPPDTKGRYFNVFHHHRVTLGSPKKYARTIYIAGPCVAFGSLAKDADTIESCLQSMMNAEHLPIRVENTSYGAGGLAAESLIYLMDNSFYRDDIVILFSFSDSFISREVIRKDTNYFTLEEIFNLPENRDLRCFTDGYRHTDEEGYYAIARFLFERLRQTLETLPEEMRTAAPPIFAEGEGPTEVMSEEMAAGLGDYLARLRPFRQKSGTVGAIVMNANPFTKGHFHLIAEARERVDHLYVFVVEEDRSEFSFTDRFEIVRRNCQEMPCVTVLPSGKYILSNETFAEYFKKAELSGEVVSPIFDVKLFGEKIAPCLGITKRFVGEEPFDSVTAEYNDAMKKILPGYGVAVIEIPRYEVDGEIVSATKVRRLIAAGDMEACRKYLTDETFMYLWNR